MPDDLPGEPAAPFRVGLVPGVTPDRWLRRWRDRRGDPLETVLLDPAEGVAPVLDGRVAMAFVRDEERGPGLHLIPLYEEVPVVVVGVEHPVAAYDEIPVDDLADELRLDRDPTLTVAQMVATAAAGTGVVVLPRSVARVHHRKDVVAVPVLGVPGSRIGLAWRTDLDDERVEAFVGIVRGRTERSSRGDAPTEPSPRAQRASGRSGSSRPLRPGGASRRPRRRR